MIQPIMIAECDMCGATKEAITRIGCYHEIEHSLPHGWDMNYDKHILLCPECAEISKGVKR